MRKALLFLLVILLPISLFASSGWNIGIEGGYTMGFYDQRGGERPYRTFSMGHAFELSVPVEYRINDWFSFSSGLRYIGKPYNMHEDNSEEGGIDLYRARNMSTMSFMAMRERYGTDLKIIGGTTTGANGPLSTNNTLNAGTFYIGESLTRCAGIQLRYIDGTSFEGIGISPDIPVNFNYDSFINGNDTRLRMAFESIRNR